MNETNIALANITDAGLFERLASDVLRFAEPEIYKSISHQGMNPQGKTIKAPLDNVGWSYVNGENRVVAVAHTTTSRNDLETKWLRDLDNVIPRKGKNPTGNDGDLVKAIKELVKIRQGNPDLKARLALMCNSEEPQAIRIRAHQLASKNNIELEIWSNSRITSFLDIDPNGQTIRHKYFNVLPSVLSYEELLRIGGLSTLHLNFKQELFVERDDIKFQSLNLVIGASGSGKTTICTNYILKKLDKRQPVLVLREENIQNSLNLDEAIEKELHRYSDRLIKNCGRKALELCSSENPLILLIEDINNTNNTEQLIKKINSWVNNEERINILCPVWYQKISTVSLKLKEELSKNRFSYLYLDNYTDGQALEALQKKCQLEEVDIDDLTLKHIAKQVGNDPLLVDLYNYRADGVSDKIIEDFVVNILENIANQKEKFRDDLEKTLLKSISYSIFNKINVVNLNQLSNFLSRDEKSDLRNILDDGRIIRLDDKNNIIFRHDRIKFLLMAQAIQYFLEAEEYLEILIDPYFSEIVGLSCFLVLLDIEKLNLLTQHNFLIGVYAYYYAIKGNSEYSNTCLIVISNWLNNQENKSLGKITLRFKSLTILNELVHSSIPKLLELYPKQDQQHVYYECGFKNGNLIDGIRWIRFFSFEVNYFQVSLVVDFVVKKYKKGLKNKIFEILKDKNTDIYIINSLFIIIGYIGDNTYFQFVKIAIDNIKEENRDYIYIFWVLSRICDENSVKSLDIVLKYWDNLSEEKDQYQRSPKNSFTVYTLDFKFKYYLPTKPSIDYLLNYARESDLKNHILYLLRLVDQPDVLEAQVNKLADWERKEYHTWGLIVDDVVRSFEEGKSLSKSSKNRLKEIFINEENNFFERKHALRIWASSPADSDLEILQTISSEDEIYDLCLMAKAQYKDLSIVDQLVVKIREDNSSYWWQVIRHIWHEKFELILEEKILTINDDNCWMLAEIFEKMSVSKAEQILEKYWENIGKYNIFIHLALLVATEKSVSLVSDSLRERNLDECFKYFNHIWGFKTEGRKGINRYEQIIAIKPYIQYLSDLAKTDLFEICLKNGWKDFAIQFIDPLLPNDSKYPLKIDTTSLSEELREGRVIWSNRWLDDYIRNGWNRNEPIIVMMDWLKNNYSDLAVDITSSNLEYLGSRSDFLILNEICDLKGKSSKIQEILKRTYWSIYSRTLE
ncbi:ATP-binding protein [Acinetobacter courvalinii]|uniref:ATP-binding protein n=1 Tax=Acinetobacter courvalinii TaxID=280147 RepID=UPI0021D1924B|nr:ATP-binding protein [Acinetobacter courvalinii]MCU4578440.1 ATP-binding protein [Acinetobacter courvalinii]